LDRHEHYVRESPLRDVTGLAVVLKGFLATDYISDPRTTPAH